MVEFFLDGISGEPLPVLLARGWCTDPRTIDIALVYADGTRAAPSMLCRELRPDVVAEKKLDFAWPGFLAEFHLTGRPGSVQLFGQTFVVPDAERYCSAQPHYPELYQTDRVLHREEIYCVGPPVPTNPEIMQLADALLGNSVL